jgi:hypothetical protein
MCPCCLNPLLSTHEALEGTFSFDATPMAPLGMEVLVHQKPSRCKTWGYHAAKAWYLSHAASHNNCICVIMKEMGGERVTDTFRYQNHAIPVQVITATDCILEATCRLTDAINGVQEAPPEKLAATQNICTLFLGKVTPQQPEPHPQPCRPEAPLTVSPPAKPEHNNARILLWDPSANKILAIHKLCPPTRLPKSPAPAVIWDIIDKFNTPPLPIVVRHPAHGQYV